MIRDWKRHSLYMDFSNLQMPKGRPSDIDMFYLCPDNGILVLGEIKNRKGTFKYYQRNLFQQIVDNYTPAGMILYIIHDEFVEQGAEMVDVSKCEVAEYYWEGKWYKPHKLLRVREALELVNRIKLEK